MGAEQPPISGEGHGGGAAKESRADPCFFLKHTHFGDSVGDPPYPSCGTRTDQQKFIALHNFFGNG